MSNRYGSFIVPKHTLAHSKANKTSPDPLPTLSANRRVCYLWLL